MLKQSCDMELHNLLGEMFFYTYCQRLQIVVVFFTAACFQIQLMGYFAALLHL